MTEVLYSRQERLPATRVDLATFGDLLDLFTGTFDHLICQADLPAGFVITEDPVVFCDALAGHAGTTNIRIRGWSRAGAEPRLGELLLADQRAEIRLDGFTDLAALTTLVNAVQARLSAAPHPAGRVYSPWFLASLALLGAFAALIVARGAGFAAWPALAVATVPGLFAGLAVALTVCSLCRFASPYAEVRGLGLRSDRRLDRAAFVKDPVSAEAEHRRGIA